MTARIIFALSFTVLGAVAATAITAASATAAFVAGVYVGAEHNKLESDNTEK